MRLTLFAITLCSLACGPVVDTVDRGTGSGDEGSTTDGSSTDSGSLDDTGTTGGEPLVVQDLLYITELHDELRAVRTDGSDDRFLAGFDQSFTAQDILGFHGGTAFAFGELVGFDYQQLAYASLDGSRSGGHSIHEVAHRWLDPSGDYVWEADFLSLERWPVDGGPGQAQNVGITGRPGFMSRSRRFAVLQSSNDLDLYDLAGEHTTILLYAPEVPNDDPECRDYAVPGFWFEPSGARAFVYPSLEFTVSHVPLGDPDAATSIDLGPEFSPLGYDTCRERLLGQQADGTVVSLDHEETITALTQPGSPTIEPGFRFSPDGRWLVSTTASGGTHHVHIADLEAGTWSSVELPDGSDTLTITTVTDEHAMVWSEGVDLSVAHRLTLATGERDERPTCPHVAPVVTEAGQFVVCEREPSDTVVGVQLPGEDAMVPIANDVVKLLLLPSDHAAIPCVDAEPVVGVTDNCSE